MISFIKTYRLQLSIAFIWLMHLSAVVGIFLGFEEWFIKLSPLNLVICALTVVLCQSRKQSLALIPVFFIGMLAEIIGVNTGFLFGHYTYGENLGVKVLGVPWLIGVNWALLVFASAGVVRLITKNLLFSVIVGSGFMVVLDVCIELQAPRFDYWQFKDLYVPLRNYLDWFVIGSLAHFLYRKIGGEVHSGLAVHLYFAFMFFFLMFQFISR